MRQADAVSLLLAGSLCLLPFLLPYHQSPILSFQAEWLAAALGTAAMLAMVTTRRGIEFVPVPLMARWLIAFALFLVAQSLIGSSNYAQQPLFGALYVLYAAVLIWLGAQLAATVGIERAAITLAACLLAGALANAVAGMVQFYGRPALLEDFVAELRGSRSYGNIAQSNLYANYLALGGTALLFLWQRHRLRTPYALAAALLLAWASALSGSRSALLYAMWFAALGLFAGKTQTGDDARRLKFAASALASALLAAHLAIPWINDALHLGPVSPGALDRLVGLSSDQTEGRWQAWPLALRVFADAPIFGAGIGELAGAIFEFGFSPEMARAGEVWTSAHNLPLHLLAETGALGAALTLGGLVTWCWQAVRCYLLTPQPALWWIITAAGIELIHSMFEYPLWNAHFLGVTALLMGLATVAATRAGTAARVSRALAAGICAVFALTLALLLRDYLRLDATRATGTSLTLASPADSERDAAVMLRLSHGPLAPIAELWMFLGAPLDRSDLAARLEMSRRAARYSPSNAVVVRRAVFLALDGQADAAQRLLVRALRTFPHLCKASVSILEQALAADRAAIEPLLALAKHASGTDRL